MSLISAACHVHSDWSYDGQWPLNKIAETFPERGYHVVLMTEHDRGFDESRRLAHRAACRHASSERILLIPGIEYSDPSNVVHLLVWGDVPFIGCGVQTEEVLSAAAKSGGIVVFAHPSRKEAWKRFNLEWKDKMLGIEFWNRKTDGWAPSKNAWPLLNASGLVPFAGLDFHAQKHFFPISTALQIEGTITEEKVINALRLRRCEGRVLGMRASTFANSLPTLLFRHGESIRRLAASSYRKLVHI
jgi:hypothetical protein